MRTFLTVVAALIVLTMPAVAFAQPSTPGLLDFPQTPAVIGGSYVSLLGAGNPRTIRTAGGMPAEVWSFVGTSGQCVEIVMRSDDLDSALLLFDNPGLAPRIREDDDSAGGRDARIEVILPKSTTYYVAAVAGIQGASEGPYTLAISPCAPRPIGDPAIGPNGQPWRAHYGAGR